MGVEMEMVPQRQGQPVILLTDPPNVEENGLLMHRKGRVNNNVTNRGCCTLSCYGFMVAGMSALSGFLFGYDLCVMVVALNIIEKDFKLTTFETEALVSTVMAGGIVGSLISGPMADRFGRKIAIMMTAALFLLGAVVMSMADSLAWIVLGRILVGIAVGASGPCVSVYVAEIAKPQERGSLVALNEVMLGFGCLSSILISGEFVSIEHGWRIMLGITCILAVMQLSGMVFMPRSPRWLLMNGRVEESRKTIERIHGIPSNNYCCEGPEQGVYEQSVGYSKLWHAIKQSPPLRRPLVLSIFIAVAQTLTGASAILYYTGFILEPVVGIGEASSSSSVATETGVVVAKLLGVLVTISTVDILGRRAMLLAEPLLLVGTAMMMLCHLAFAMLTNNQENYYQSSNREYIVGLLHVFIFAWSMSWAPLMWIVCSEILPTKIRSTGMSISLALFFLMSTATNQTLLTLFKGLGMSNTFVFYGAMTSAVLLVVFFVVPETRGKSLDEINAMFQPVSLDDDDSPLGTGEDVLEKGHENAHQSLSLNLV